MPNMSYCQFDNTAGDLQDCVNSMTDAVDMLDLELSESETRGYNDLLRLCKEFIRNDARLKAATTAELAPK